MSGQQTGPTHVIEVEWTLAELPSAQHRAGLAGLVLLVRWIGINRSTFPGTLDVRCDARGAVLTVDRVGMASLFDATYGATREEQRSKQPWKDKPPLRVDVETTVDDKGKARTQTWHVYEVAVPTGAFLPHRDPHGPWVKLWRDMVWTILRGVPATRGPYNARAEGEASSDTGAAYDQLLRGDRPVELPSTYYLGAQANTAENVPFKDRGRYQFLLHFWPFTTALYVPAREGDDGRLVHEGYAFAIPDVADLETFCADYDRVLDEWKQPPEMAGYRPRAALVDLADESGLDLLRRLDDVIGAAAARRSTSDLVLAIEVIHAEKEGNNVRIRGVRRVEPEPGTLATYRRIRKDYSDRTFRRQRLTNLLHGVHWWTAFDRLAATTSIDDTIGSRFFRRDCRTAFTHGERMATDDERDDTMEGLIYRAVGMYLSYKVENRYGLTWKGAEGEEAQGRFREARLKVAREAFLAVRARDEAAFRTYFAETLCSGPIKLDSDRFQKLSRYLLDQTQDFRTLTLLALSARA